MALLTGKIVCITGSSRGTGRACAVESARYGATGLILHYFGDLEAEAELLSLKQEIETADCKVVGVPGDIADSNTAQKIVTAGVAAFGGIVSNAGICPFAEFLTMPHATWERTRQVNLDGSFYVVQAVANQMKVQLPQGGSIVGVASISALVGGEFQCHYTPTKAGILSMMQSCAEDLAHPEKREYTIKRTVLGRLGNPGDVAGPVVFLASDLAKYVTGAQLLVDGGLFVNLQ
ncbi:hypothetical protein PAXINDRAFT_173843 [Paxillus involutus ATCC 200175]|nr:hypothetical protein PAXINDRAFT_173843 [Paxillus involutus ATCC 200175]